MRWIFAAGLLVLVLAAGAQITGGAANRDVTPVDQPPLALASYEVTARALNVRAAPASGAAVLGQVEKGYTFTPTQKSGHWYAIEMSDGRTGWVYNNFISRVVD